MDRLLSHTTAILVFANTSSEEIRRKKIVRGKPLFKALTEHTLKTVKETGVPFFHITENEQLGESFGERFTNAIQYVFDQGYENIITVGNDSPHLTKASLLNAVLELENGRSVIGPSADGGFYLMGLHRSNFKKPNFKALSWQTSRLKEEIVNLLSTSPTKIHLLPTLFDIDTFSDVEIVGGYISRLGRAVLKAIRAVLSSNKGRTEIRPFSLRTGSHSRIPFNKGSPSLSFS